jgi:hypothetical protein
MVREIIKKGPVLDSVQAENKDTSKVRTQDTVLM